MEKQRMTLILSERPDECTAQEVSLAAMEVAGGITLLSWEVSQDVPQDMGIDVRDQLTATLRDSGPEACVLVVWVGL